MTGNDTSLKACDKRVKANAGAAGVDEESLEDFAKDLKNNLYNERVRFNPKMSANEVASADFFDAYKLNKSYNNRQVELDCSDV